MMRLAIAPHRSLMMNNRVDDAGSSGNERGTSATIAKGVACGCDALPTATVVMPEAAARRMRSATTGDLKPPLDRP